MKIHIVTSMVNDFDTCKQYASQLRLELGTGNSIWIEQPAHLNEKEQKSFADELCKLSGNIIVITFYELTMLRLLRKLKASEMVFYNISDEMVQKIGVILHRQQVWHS